jgi:hypothetical protein
LDPGESSFEDEWLQLSSAQTDGACRLPMGAVETQRGKYRAPSDRRNQSIDFVWNHPTISATLNDER